MVFSIDHCQRSNLIEKGSPVRLSELDLKGLNGEPFSFEKNEKKSIVYFFAPWCEVCKYSVPALNSFYLERKLDIILIALDYESIDDVARFKEENQIIVPIFLGNSEVRDQFRIEAYPTLYILNKDQEVTSSRVGYTPAWLLSLKVLF